MQEDLGVRQGASRYAGAQPLADLQQNVLSGPAKSLQQSYSSQTGELCNFKVRLCMQHSSLTNFFEMFAGIHTILCELCRSDSKGNHSCCWSKHLFVGSRTMAAEGNYKDIFGHVAHSLDAVPCLWLTCCVLCCSLSASHNMLLSLPRYVNATLHTS